MHAQRCTVRFHLLYNMSCGTGLVGSPAQLVGTTEGPMSPDPLYMTTLRTTTGKYNAQMSSNSDAANSDTVESDVWNEVSASP